MKQEFDYGILIDWEEALSGVLAEVAEMYEDNQGRVSGVPDIGVPDIGVMVLYLSGI